MTVIADDAGVHDIAGIMGGEHSGVTAETRDIVLEIAYFDPEHIGVTGRKLGLASDARTRFERGVDPAFLDEGLALLTALIVENCGGAASEVVRAGSPPDTARTVAFDPGLTRRLGGVEIAAASDFRIAADGHRRPHPGLDLVAHRQGFAPLGLGGGLATDQSRGQGLDPLDRVTLGSPRRTVGQHLRSEPAPGRRHVAIERVEVERQVGGQGPGQGGVAGRVRATRHPHQGDQQVGQEAVHR